MGEVIVSTNSGNFGGQSADNTGHGPVGNGNHIVRQGECIESIAFEKGFFWKTIWNDSQNKKLNQVRKNPNTLFAGDKVYVPEKRQKQLPCATEQRHRFKRKGVPSMLRLQLLDEDKPRANESYVLEIDGELSSGTTDADGRLERAIPAKAKKGKLRLGEEQDEYVFDLGHIDPIDEITGIQARLNNLGFNVGPVDGINGPETKDAIRDFQGKYGLTVDGVAGPQTQAKLKEVHGC